MPPLPQWWIEKARALVENYDGTQEELIGKLGKRAGRTWDRTALSNFVRGVWLPGPSLVFAISDHFGIERPYFVARSESEARAIRSLQELASPPQNDASIRMGADPKRLEQLDEDRHQLERELNQTQVIASPNEGRAKGTRRT